jgi:hypothetical protein
MACLGENRIEKQWALNASPPNNQSPLRKKLVEGKPPVCVTGSVAQRMSRFPGQDQRTGEAQTPNFSLRSPCSNSNQYRGDDPAKGARQTRSLTYTWTTDYSDHDVGIATQSFNRSDLHVRCTPRYFGAGLLQDTGQRRIRNAEAARVGRDHGAQPAISALRFHPESPQFRVRRTNHRIRYRRNDFGGSAVGFTYHGCCELVALPTPARRR